MFKLAREENNIIIFRPHFLIVTCDSIMYKQQRTAQQKILANRDMDQMLVRGAESGSNRDLSHQHRGCSHEKQIFMWIITNIL